MNTKWLSNLKTKQEKDKFKQYLLSCDDAFIRLSEILKEDLEQTVKEMSVEDGYDSPAWAERQADRLGKIRTLRKVIELVHLKGKQSNG
jgi:hypothetical protein